MHEEIISIEEPDGRR